MKGRIRNVWTSAAADGVIAAVQLGAAAASGSASMLAAGLHSVADAGETLLHIVGEHRSRRPPDEHHPFGYGEELYFWSLVIAFAVFAIGGLASVVYGVVRIANPERGGSGRWAYIALGIALLVECASAWSSWRQFEKERKPREGPIEGAQHAKNMTTPMITFENIASVAGICIALVSIWLSHQLRVPALDGVGAILIGVLQASVALFLTHEIRQLMVGERAVPELLHDVRDVVENDPTVIRATQPKSVHFGPQDILIAIGAEFYPTLEARAVELAVARMRDRIRERHTDVKFVYIEPCLPGTMPDDDGKGREEGNGAGDDASSARGADRAADQRASNTRERPSRSNASTS